MKTNKLPAKVVFTLIALAMIISTLACTSGPDLWMGKNLSEKPESAHCWSTDGGKTVQTDANYEYSWVSGDCDVDDQRNFLTGDGLTNGGVSVDNP